jgi:prepilin-type N-terminal cleavage/methylation domain-containing protein
VILNTPRKIEIIRGESGFTLIEVVIAIGIFAIGFLAVGLMQINAMNTTNFARRHTEAMTLAEDQAEFIRFLPFYIAGTDYIVPPPLVARDETNPHMENITGPFTIRWTVTDDEPILPHHTDVKATSTGAPVTRSKTIRVWVTPDNNAGDRQAELEFVKFCGKCES